MYKLEEVARQVVVCHGMVEALDGEVAHFEVGITAVEELQCNLVCQKRPLLEQ